MYPGALLDTRLEEEKLKDFTSREVSVSVAPPSYSHSSIEQCRKFPVRNQATSLSCVAQTGAKMLGVENSIEEGRYVDFSAYDIYEQRSNKPSGGMIGVEALNILTKKGATLDSFIPSQNLNEEQMNTPLNRKTSDIEIGKVFRAGGFVQTPVNDIDSTASVIEHQKKAAMVWFYFTSEEWSRVEPIVINENLTIPTGLRHSVTAVDTLRWNGKKALLVEDSAHFGGHTRHIITEDFLKARCWFSAYLLNFANEWGGGAIPTKPTHTFNQVMEFGQTSDEIKILQRCLQWLTFFPTNIDCTGYYGAITAKAVLAYQKSRQVAPDSELDPLQGRRVGAKTLGALNLDFSV